MGTIIRSSAITRNGSASALELTVRAGEACIEKAGISKSDVDLLINVGIYHDDNIMEPAMAPLIQKKLGINPDPVLEKTNKTFCFDLYNGACGFINAVQVAEGFLKSGRARNVLVVSGDSHPSGTVREDFPFTPIGAAVLLSFDEKKTGFSRFRINTSGTSSHGLTGGADLRRFGQNGRKFIEVLKEEDYLEKLLDFTAKTASEYARDLRIEPDSVSFIIGSLQGNGIGREVQRAMGLNGSSKIVDLNGRFGDPHTASLPLGFHTISEDGSLKENDRILFAAAGSGYTTAFAMYTA